MRVARYLLVGVLFSGNPATAKDDSVWLGGPAPASLQGRPAWLAPVGPALIQAAASARAASPGAAFGPATRAAATASGPKNYAEQDLSERNMDGQNLDGADFTGAVLKKVSFYGTSMRGAIFKDADLRQATFFKADLSGTDFRDSLMGFFAKETNFSRANFEGVDMKSAWTFGDNFNGANLRGTTGWADVTACSFRGADLRGANLVTARNVGGTETMNDIFTGAIYDGSTRWPASVQLDSLKARRVN